MALESKSKIAIIGGGPAGCFCAYYLKQNEFSPVIFEKNSPLKTLLPTGGGRCNLAHAEFDFKELAKNYPRGEKFLYSVFSKFSTSDTIEVFEKIGVKTYTQDDMRIFPISNSASDVRAKMLEAIKGAKFIKENVLSVKPCNGGYEVKTNGGSYFFEKVIFSIGGHASFDLLKNLGIEIIPPKPALTGLRTIQNFKSLSGVSVQNVTAKVGKQNFRGDFLFTHDGISGPVVFTVSSIMVREAFPYKITFDFAGEIDLQCMLNENSHKSVKNLLSSLVPKSFAAYITEHAGVSENLKCSDVNGKTRNAILKYLNDFEVEAVSVSGGGEVVTSGGVDLREVNPKTMEAKKYQGIYFCGEVLDIDGLCGGFNLQNCWSTGYLAAQGVAKSAN